MNEELNDWQTDVSEITIHGLKTLCEELVHARSVKEAATEVLKEKQEAVDFLESKILMVMQENALPNFKGEFGSISIKTTRSVSQPENLDEKLKLFDYLKSQSVFEEMVNVNSRTLSSWANKEIEQKEKEGVFGWTPPGLKQPNEFKSLSVRKK